MDTAIDTARREDGHGARAHRAVRRPGAARRAAGLLAVAGVVLGFAAPATASSGNGLAQAKQDLLVRADFPSGWHGQGSVQTSTGGGSSFPGAAQLASCLGVSASVVNLNTPSVTSPTFQNRAGTDYVQDNVAVFPSTKVARQQYTVLANAKVPGCMTEALKGPAGQQLTASIGKGATVGAYTVAAVRPSWLVPHTTGFTISFPVTEQGITLNSTITVVSMVRGKTGSQISFTAVGTPFPASLAHHLVATAYART